MTRTESTDSENMKVKYRRFFRSSGARYKITNSNCLLYLGVQGSSFYWGEAEYTLTIIAPSLHYRFTITAKSQPHRCTIAALSMYHRFTIAAHSLHNQCTIASPSLQNHYTITWPQRQFVYIMFCYIFSCRVDESAAWLGNMFSQWIKVKFLDQLLLWGRWMMGHRTSLFSVVLTGIRSFPVKN